jgi:hypothetical protein
VSDIEFQDWFRNGYAFLFFFILMILFIVMISMVGSSHPYDDTIFLDLDNKTKTVDPTDPIESVAFRGLTWSTINSTDPYAYYDVMYSVDHPEFPEYSAQPDVLHLYNNSKEVIQIVISIPSGILAGFYELDIIASIRVNGSYPFHYNIEKVTIEVLERRWISIEAIYGNVEPRDPDGYYEQLIVLSNKGNTIEQFFCQMEYRNEITDAQFKEKPLHDTINSENPIELQPGEHVIMTVFLDMGAIGMEDKQNRVRLGIKSVEDEKLLDSHEWVIFIEQESNSWDWMDTILVIIIMIIAITSIILIYRYKKRDH